jgi:hypothetical protein
MFIFVERNREKTKPIRYQGLKTVSKFALYKSNTPLLPSKKFWFRPGWGGGDDHCLIQCKLL